MIRARTMPSATLNGVAPVACRHGRAVGGGGLRAAVRVKVTDHQCRPRCRQVAAKWHTDIAEPLDGDSQPLQVAAAEADLRSGAQSLEHAERSRGQGLLT